jgi:hypothetical protein
MAKTLSEWQTEIHEVNKANGWHDDPRSFGDGAALLHSEVSEMFEAYRDHGLEDFSRLQFTADPGYGLRSEKSVMAIRRFERHRDAVLADLPTETFEFAKDEKMALAVDGVSKPEGVGSEMADIFIRLMDEVDRSGIDLEWEVTRKLAYNRTRGHRHGGKRV